MYQELVLESAERVFAEHGYHASKMQQVAAEAGISLGTLYGAFPSKRDVFEALHEFRGRQFLARIEPAVTADRPAREALALAVRAFVDFLTEHRDYFRVDLREGRSWAIGDVEQSRAFQVGISRWTDLLERGIREGVFFDEEPELLATTVFGTMQLLLAALLARGEAPDPEALTARILRHLERSLCPAELLVPGELRRGA